MRNPYSKTFLDFKFLFVSGFQPFAAHFRTKGIVKNDKIILFMRVFHIMVIRETRSILKKDNFRG